MKSNRKLTFQPLTADRWPDLEKLFGPRGACGGCWCMVWRLRRADFDQGKGDRNRQAFHDLVAGGAEPGVLAYAGGEAVGWCAVAPRADYPALARSRVLAPVDDCAVWSITCLYVARPYRRRGVSVRLLKAAVQLARRHGARVVEGYPIEPYSAQVPAAFAWTGLVSAFRQAGFREVLRRSEKRPIMRWEGRTRAKKADRPGLWGDEGPRPSATPAAGCGGTWHPPAACPPERGNVAR